MVSECWATRMLKNAGKNAVSCDQQCQQMTAWMLNSVASIFFESATQFYCCGITLRARALTTSFAKLNAGPT